jgi:sugar fermentation stimulation protein A
MLLYKIPVLLRTQCFKREKRFLMHTNVGTAHCPNTGSLASCFSPNDMVWVSMPKTLRGAAKRKYEYTAEYVEQLDGLVCINTQRANQMVFAVLERLFINNKPKKNKQAETQNADRLSIQDMGAYLQGSVQNVLAGYTHWQQEYAVSQDTRFDFILTNTNHAVLYGEIKSVSFLQDNIHHYPDSVTTRGTKHVDTLTELLLQDTTHRVQCVVVYVLYRHNDLPWDRRVPVLSGLPKDPIYGEAMNRFLKAGGLVWYFVPKVYANGDVYLEQWVSM